MGQKLKYKNLYIDCKKAVAQNLESLWIGETADESQCAYAQQLEKVIADIFAPADSMPIVECNNPYESIPHDQASQAEAFVGDLWRKIMDLDEYYPPYLHQAKAWKALTEDVPGKGPKSIVVTTGTGSGKTECFMLPLVNDIIENGVGMGVQAIFLYPLNALMDDQKDRLEQLLKDTGIRYAVFNSNLAETDDGEKDSTDKIKLASGEYIDENGEIKYKYPHAVTTREDMRNNPPEILITNPTMLEYILMRKADDALIRNHALKWIVLDEAHTYSGAGAAELAMLLRRVMIAYEKNPREIRFAASSATLGNKEDEKEKKAVMKKFISDITGTSTEQIEVIDGKQIGLDERASGPYGEYWNRLFDSSQKGAPYIRLDDLIPQYNNIEEKLGALDGMCDKAPKDARLKVHFFFRVPNGGIYVKINELQKGYFKIYTDREATIEDKDKAPQLELCRCMHCGEYITTADVDISDSISMTYSAPLTSDRDMFDLDEFPQQSDKKKYIFNISKGENINAGDNNFACAAKDNKIDIAPGIVNGSHWVVVANTAYRCPNCGTKLIKNTANDEIEEDNSKLMRFRISTEMLSCWIAPIMLRYLKEHGDEKLHKGQQFISFVDSRQGAARATLKQNLEIERQWLYSKIFHALNKKQISDGDNSTFLSWTDISELLYDDPMSDLLVKQFAGQSSRNDELDDDGSVSAETKQKYIYSIMVDKLARRPLSGLSPETIGLFTSTYPKLKAIRNRETLPDAVKRFNDSIDSDNLKISSSDWADLLHIFLDFTVRSNESIYLQPDFKGLDIFDCVRFSTKKSSRRSVKKPDLFSRVKSRIVYLLAQLLVDDGQADDINEALKSSDLIQGVIDALWDDLIKSKLLQRSTRFDKRTFRYVPDENLEKDGQSVEPWRLNVVDIAFKPFDKATLVNTLSSLESPALSRQRTINVLFKGYSPYLADRIVPVKPSFEFEDWTPFNLDEEYTDEQILVWAKENRKLLWDNGIWGEKGAFSRHLLNAFKAPDLFLQAEHTAQIDKITAKQIQENFKNHELNILACSTTMEMGVDLGTLELVMMSSIPPMPMNYKQRAGRSGRSRSMTKSVAITLCSSDSIGLRTLYNPLLNLINREVKAPEVDLFSPQVIQRHVNAFLMRESGIFGGRIKQDVLDYYFSRFSSSNDTGRDTILNQNGQAIAFWEPSDFEDGTDTNWENFRNFCSSEFSEKVAKKIDILLFKTYYEGKLKETSENAIRDNQNCRDELISSIIPILTAYKETPENRTKQRQFFYLKIREILRRQLISFWAKNRFISNANMPTNIVSYNLYPNEISEKIKHSNATYDLRQALSQYAPGRTVVAGGRATVVRGVRFKNSFDSKNITFKTIYRDTDRVAIDNEDALNGLVSWNVNGKRGLEMIQPVEFMPDVNESASRITDQNQYTRVNAQLINAVCWPEWPDEVHLYDAIGSESAPDSKILYYNDGLGYGYCYCLECGRIVVETCVANDNRFNPSPLEDLPAEMNNQISKKTGQPFHYHMGKPCEMSLKFCPGSDGGKKLHRNIVLADEFSTDYTEIRIRRVETKKLITSRANENDEKLLTTLALLFTRAYAEYSGRERSNFDFAITPNGHIVIFDTNPGGAGYSNKLALHDIFKEVVKRAYAILLAGIERNSMDFLLDSYTLHYLPNIDLVQARKWIEAELAIDAALPVYITEEFGENVVVVDFEALKASMELGNPKVILFFNDNFEEWNYGDTQSGWLAAHMSYLRNNRNVDVCLLTDSPQSANIPVLANLQALGFNVFAVKNPFKNAQIHPVAEVDGRLFVSLNYQNNGLNQFWGNGVLYSTKATIENNLTPLELHKETIKIIKLKGNENKIINADDLPGILWDKAREIFVTFLNHCENVDSPLEISYQDKHLKNPVGMIITLKIIKYFVEKLDKSFSLSFMLEEYEGNESRASIESNMPNSNERDNLLSIYTRKMLEEPYLRGCLNEIKSYPKNKLTHWRVLTLKCGDMALAIYPDGGFSNGWKVNFEYGKSLTIDNIDFGTRITLKRIMDLKFDIAVETREET